MGISTIFHTLGFNSLKQKQTVACFLSQVDANKRISTEELAVSTPDGVTNEQ